MFTLAKFIAITPVTATSDSDKRWRQPTLTIVLVLATLGDATQIGLFLQGILMGEISLYC
jgi:hypothetical protein